jgi:hypothetical protein
MQIQSVCHDTLRWLISFSLDVKIRIVAIGAGWSWISLSKPRFDSMPSLAILSMFGVL